MKHLEAPNGALITGTLETVTARANINDVLGHNDDSTFALDYEGYTEIFWDSQKTVQRDVLHGDVDGATYQRVFLDEDGNEWIESDLRLINDDEKAND